LARTTQRAEDASEEVALAASRIDVLRRQQRAAAIERQAARSDAFLLSVSLAEQRRAAHEARAEARVLRTDLSMVALDAYVLAANRMAEERPGCRLSWIHLAGIGRVESRHGTYRGSTLSWDGTTDPPIIGVALTGAGGVALVGDSDGGALDGDATYDRAVGPMQFIPSSWRIYGRDGNGDGEEDPHSIYDAAMAAAEHLCRRHAGLDQPDGLRAALLSYNRSVAYGERVMALGQEYAEARLPVGRAFRPFEQEGTEASRRSSSAIGVDQSLPSAGRAVPT
jgi:membrane-bound lytic murein transglycosylase B